MHKNLISKVLEQCNEQSLVLLLVYGKYDLINQISSCP